MAELFHNYVAVGSLDPIELYVGYLTFLAELQGVNVLIWDTDCRQQHHYGKAQPSLQGT